MNRERIKAVITQLGKVPPKKFNMGGWFRGAVRKLKGGEEPIANEKATCGTSACIAGWAILLFDDGAVTVSQQTGNETMERARKLLDLTEGQARKLFLGKNPDGYTVPGGLESITKVQAINTLERLLATGEVRWDQRDVPVR